MSSNKLATPYKQGLVGPGTQTFGGNKTFQNDVTVSGNAAVSGTLSASLSATSTVQLTGGATTLASSGITIEDVVNYYPTLDIDFTDKAAISSKITFTRNSTAVYYDNKTTTKAEENLFLQSQDFTNAAWSNTNTTDTANTTTAPDGTLTADTITETTTTGSHAFNQSVSIIDGNTYTFSVFVKKGDGATARNFVQLHLAVSDFGTNGHANFDIVNGTVTVTGAGLVSANITSIGNGWYRCSITDTAIATVTSSLAIYMITSGTSARAESYAGSTTANMFLWGAQLEQRSSITDYTPTTAQIVRNYIPTLLSAAANEIRVDHNPITREPLGYLAEEARTNLLTYSEDFNNAAWIKTRASINSNIIIAPDGTLTADKLVEDTTASNNHSVSNSNAVTGGASYTATVYAKAAERSRIVLGTFDGTTGLDGVFNLSTGVVDVTPATTTCTMENVGNGWYRCRLTRTVAAGATNLAIYFYTDNATSGAASNFYTGNGYSGVYIWGAQLETGYFPSSYIKTVAATATRPAEFALMTGTNFSSWFRDDEGTIYVEYTLKSDIVSANIVWIDDTTASNVISIRISSTSIAQFTVAVNGVNQANLSLIGYNSLNTTYKRAVKYAVNSFQQAIDGVLPNAEDTSGMLPMVSRLSIGFNGSTDYLNGYIKRLIYWPERLDDSTLRIITALN